MMKTKRHIVIISICAVALLFAGCAEQSNLNKSNNNSNAQAAESNPEIVQSPTNYTVVSPDKTESWEGENIALKWKNTPSPPQVRKLTDWPQMIEKKIREYEFHGFDGSKVILYAKKGDDNLLHAAFSAKDVIYDLGPVAGHGYVNEGDVSAEDVMVFHKHLLQITGTMGAAYAMTKYFSIEDGVPKPFLVVDTGNAQHLDLDFDGVEEIVSTGGLPNYAYVYRWNKDHVEMCDLNETLNATSVSISTERAIEVQYRMGDPVVKLFRFSANELRPIGRRELTTGS